jgi:hypothetical protein
MTAYKEEYRPLLLKCSNKSNIPVSMINIEDMEDIIKGVRADAIDGHDNVSDKEAKTGGDV